MYQVQKKGKKAIARELGISMNTVKKYCDGSHVPWQRKQYVKCFEEDDREGLKKQTHTAKRIFDRLVVEEGFTGGKSTVRLAVQYMKNSISKAYVP